MAGSHSKQFVIYTSLFGIVSFLLGIFAELKKPVSGIPIQGKDVVICKFPNDPSVALGSLSVLAVLISTAIGVVALFFPYKGKSVPKKVLLHSGALRSIFVIATVLTMTGAGITLWTTIAEALKHVQNVHYDLETDCATTKTGMFGGAAFLNLDACLFWLIALMLTHNVREDYLEEEEDDDGGHYNNLSVGGEERESLTLQ